LKTGKELMDIIFALWIPIYKISGMLLIWNWKEWFGLAWKIIWGYLTLTC
jgi:hypothetical protein